MTKKEFNLSERRLDMLSGYKYPEKDVKEFIRLLLTPNNISKGFVEVSTIKYYAGDKLVEKRSKEK